MNCSLQVLSEEDGCGKKKNNSFGMLSCGVSTSKHKLFINFAKQLVVSNFSYIYVHSLTTHISIFAH